MTAKGFDYYDQMTAAAVLPSPAPAPTATPRTAATTRSAPERLLRACAALLIVTGVVFLAVLLVAVTPLGDLDVNILNTVDMAIGVPVVGTGIIAIVAWAVLK